ncbi:MAG: Multidrug export protein MepA [Chloroflexi bacterium ADurb.Bin325]|nr:MAG: Multidrug export protein MepA [Chloroflexi bacterium ADurb.Bin325]
MQRLGLGDRSVDITHGRLRDNIWQLGWPLMISQGLSFFPGLYDGYWLSRLGAHALAAATIAITLRLTLISVLMALSGASAAVISRYVGAEEHGLADRAATQAVILFVLASGSLGILGLIFIEPLLAAAGASGDLLAPTIAYARVIFAGLIALEMVPSMGSMLSSSGNPQLSLQMNLLTLFSLLILEPLLIWLGWGVTGAALALVLANTAGMIYGLFLLASGRAAVRIEWRYARPDPPMMWRILRIAIPGIVQRGIPNLTNTILLRFMAGYGAAPVAAFSLFGRQSGLLLAPAGGLAATAPAMVGQNLGAGQPARASRAVRLAAWAAGISAAVALGLLMLFATPVYTAFTSDPATIALGVQVIGVLSLYRLLLLLSTVLDGALTGAGDTVSPMVINFISQIVVLLPTVWLLSTGAGWGIHGIFWALVVGFGVQTLLMALRFRQGRWQSQRI